MATLQNDGKGLWAQQDKDAFLDYALDWSDWLSSAHGDSINTSTWTADPQLTISTFGVDGAVTSVWVQGGVQNKWYALVNTVVSAQGRRDQRVIRLYITNEADVGPQGTAVFPSRAKVLDELRRDNLMIASQTYLSGVEMSDDYLFDKLRAAEAYVQHSLRCYLAPTVIIPDDAPQSEIDALEAAGTRYAQEAAYDYDPSFFSADNWGYIVAKSRPIISVESMRFHYPTPTRSIWEIPHEWIRLDRKYGHIRLIPQAMSVSVPVAGFIMNALGGGRPIPFMIQLRYTAGIKNINAEYPEIVTAIKRMAVLNVLKDSFTPQSGSISADGLSQSVSADMDKYSDSIDKALDTARDQIHGVRFIVC